MRNLQVGARALLREAWERSGRTDGAALRRCLDEVGGIVRGETADEVARLAADYAGLRVAEGEGPLRILPPGLDPAVGAALAEIAAEEKEIRSRLEAVGLRRGRIMLAACEARLAEEGKRHSGDLVGSGHACDPSPTGYCCYDAKEDPASDFCVFCGRPDERR